MRASQVAELQRAVRDAQVYLYDERETALRLQSENEALKLGDIENRRRVQHLLALTQPVGRDTTFFQPAEGRSVAASAPGSRSTASRSAPGAAAPRHPPSAVPPSGWDDAAAEGAASARAAAAESHLRAAHALLEERGEAWRREREDAEEEARAAREAARGREEALESELRRERAKSRATAEELIRVRAGAQQSETRMREEACALRRGLERLEAKHESAVRAASSELSAVRQSADEEAERLVADAAASAEGREADAASMRSEFAAVRRLYADKLASAEARGKDLEGRLRKLERRRALDLEGFGADVSALRRALEQLETQWALVGATAADMAARDGDPSGLASAIRMGEGMVRRAWSPSGAAGPSPQPGPGSPATERGQGRPASRAGRPPLGGVTAFRPTLAATRAKGGAAMASSRLVPASAAAANAMMAAARPRGAGLPVEDLWRVGGSPPESEGGSRTAASHARFPSRHRASRDGGAADGGATTSGDPARGAFTSTTGPRSHEPQRASFGTRWEPAAIKESLSELRARASGLQATVAALS